MAIFSHLERQNECVHVRQDEHVKLQPQTLPTLKAG